MLTAEKALLNILFVYHHTAMINDKDFCLEAIKSMECSALIHMSKLDHFSLCSELLREVERTLVIKKAQSGFSARQISKELGVGRCTVYRILKRNGVELSKQNASSKAIASNKKLGVDFYSRLLKQFDSGDLK